MADHKARPTIDLQAGTAALAEQLPIVLAARGVSKLEDLEWRLDGKRRLLVPFRGKLAGTTEGYLLRLNFLTGRDWPPSAQFVNPATLDYVVGTDQHHLPNLQSSEVHVHPEYASPQGGKIQLVCCSATLEYYDVLHGGEDKILWRASDTFDVTINAIARAFAQNYHGRHPVNAR